MSYDEQNVFAKILRGEIPNKTVYEDEHVLAFEDIQPQAPVHVLVIPKGPYKTMNEFSEQASDEEIVAWVRAIGKVAKITETREDGHRLIVNTGENGVQDVPHLHIHLLGGRRLGRMLQKPD
ncbi:histidine triad nucleotide-binding protein [uncultured Nisaea sp.]|jgi:histidine triad (HIT) family protein|uniref:histidine triad nucleotide-binding protein n=1 Tax=uncultured Nisaea sp. TaxID=538215 RepID=UPI000ED268B3|nr:histidine triad nucleotide-binding protein [Erythrobacter sp.]|tara:strand:+ start:1625 stop:1990 length:366 start_codon:yes stop_codon:yes gene_type:complete